MRGLEVAAGAEGRVAGAGQDADECIVVGAEAVPRVDELSMCLRPNGIHALGTVDGDDGDGPALFVEQMLVVAHRTRQPLVEGGVEAADRAFVRAELDERVGPGVQSALDAFRHFVVLDAALVQQVARALAASGSAEARWSLPG